MSMDWNLPAGLLAGKYWDWLLSGWYVTIGSSVCVIVLASLLGLPFALARSNGHWLVRSVAALYLSVFRNTPLLVQLFFWYFAVPSLLPEHWMQALNQHHSLTEDSLLRFVPTFEVIAAITGLVLYSTAYVGEEIRAGLRSIPSGQWQAARSLGMTQWQALRHIVLPQALRNVISPLFGQYMNIVKNTSLGMAIGLMELSYRTRQVEAETFQSFQAYAIATLLYIVLIVLLQWLGHRLQAVQPGRPA